MFHRTTVIFSSLLALTACTQPAAMVDLRGQDDFSKSGGRMFSYNTAAPVAPISTSPVQSNYPEQHKPSLVWSKGAQPVTTAASNNSSIAVNDLEPAAGKAEAPIAAKPEPLAVELKTEQKTETKTQSLNTESTPVNAWTGKSRDAASFGEKPEKGAQFIWPVASHEVTKASDGITIAASEGEPVWASADGEIVYADNKMQGYGKMVIVKHAGGKTTTYAHLARYGVEKYDRVKQGDIIGYVGTTGKAKTPQLYFSMRDGTKAIDPQKYLDRKVAGL